MLRDRSIVAMTDAEASFPNLEPWIQWVTVHTGLTHQEHEVFDLSDGPRLAVPRIWDLASRAGKKVWVCGSMNAAIQGETINGMVVPDPWATDIQPQPPGVFDPFFDLVRPFVQEYTSGRPRLKPATVINFAKFMLAHGLSVRTVIDTVEQLVGELRAPIKWRRATILDRLQWDVFRQFYKRERPALSTLFLNSTAHFQHYFWRDMSPELFAAPSKLDAQARYDSAILFGYQKMDRIVGECLQIAGPETSIVMCTGLGQRPMFDYEDIGGKQIFKMKDPDAFFAFAGLQGYVYAPVMAEQFHLLFDNEADASDAVERLLSCRLDDGTSVMMARRDGTRVFAGCDLVKEPAPASLVSVRGANRSQRFDALFYPVESVRSGMHDPGGLLWISMPDRRHVEVERQVSLTEIAPTLLFLAGVETDHPFSRPIMAEVQGMSAVEASATAAACGAPSAKVGQEELLVDRV
jgi:hypothetical protein